MADRTDDPTHDGMGGATPRSPTLMPMFPLGSVLLPSMLLSLQVFEPRYLRMLRDMRSEQRTEFGVVLIERGSEVGGGDVRTDVGCVARILEVRGDPDGRVMLDCVGARRIAVREWMDDDPYPRALVHDLADPSDQIGGEPGRPAATFERVESLLVRVCALASELGAPDPPDPSELDDDPVLRSYQLGVLAPLGSLDRQRVLTASGPGDRIEVLSVLLVEQIELLTARLSLGDG